MAASKAKPFDISKQAVWKAWLRVKANQGAAGVDEQSIAAFEADLTDNLYKLWNRIYADTATMPRKPALACQSPDGGGLLRGAARARVGIVSG